MYDKDIEVLATLYEKKDFKGASRALGLKEATLKGKIASLEERFGIRILAEDKGEPIFTRAGKSIAEDAIFIIKYSNTAIGKAQHLEVEDGFFIKVGSSMLSPEKELLSLLEERKTQIEPLAWQSVHFFSIEETLKHLESHVDILSTFFDERLLKKYSLSAIELRKERLMVALRKDAELASVPMLDVEDMYGKKLYIYRKGYLKAFDQLRADIMEYHKDIEIVSFDAYDEKLERRIEEEDSFLVTFKPLEEGMSMLTLRPVLWNYSSPFGILCKKEASAKVRKIIEVLKKEELR